MVNLIHYIYSRGIFSRILRYLATVYTAIMVTISSVFCITAFAFAIFPAELTQYLHLALAMMLMSIAVVTLCTLFWGNINGVITGIKATTIPIISLIALDISLDAGDSPIRPFAHFLMLIAFSTICSGALYILIAKFNLESLPRFIPYPVTCAFMGGAGFLFIELSMAVIFGERIGVTHLEYSLLDKFSINLTFVLGITLSLCLTSYLSKNRRDIVTLLLVVIIGSYYLIVLKTGVDKEFGYEMKWLLSADKMGVMLDVESFVTSIQLEDFLSLFAWDKLNAQFGNMLAIILMNVLSTLFAITGLEFITNNNIDLNKEFNAIGKGNIIVGFLGGIYCGHLIDNTTITHKNRSIPFISSLIFVALTLALLFYIKEILTILPLPLIGGLLLYTGISLVFKWVILPLRQISKIESTLMVFLLFIILFDGYTSGIFASFFISLIILAINYTSIDIVNHVLTGKTHQGNVDRDAASSKYLEENGDQYVLYLLHGYMFEGTANHLYHRINRDFAQKKISPRFLIIDLRKVVHLNMSVFYGFNKLRNLTCERGISFILSGIDDAHWKSFLYDFLVDPNGNKIKSFKHYHEAVEWCENKILLMGGLSTSLENTTFSGARKNLLTHTLLTSIEQDKEINPEEEQISSIIDYFEKEEVQEDRNMLIANTEHAGLIFIESGSAEVYLKNVFQEVVKIRTVKPGNIIGVRGLYFNSKSRSTVKIRTGSIIYVLTNEKLKMMEKYSPKAASLFHRYVINSLSDKIYKDHRTLQNYL